MGELSTKVKERIDSERVYHDSFYEKKQVPSDVAFDLATSEVRRPQNLTWAYYDTIRERFDGDLAGKQILVIGCGTGLVTLNLAKEGAKVHAFDLSPKAVEICRTRAEHNGVLQNVRFSVTSCEEFQVEPAAYDAVVGEMILHHVDIPIAMEKTFQSLRPGGVGVFMEWKEYTVLDTFRRLPVLRTIFPPGGYSNYATEFERKLDRADIDICRKRFPDLSSKYRYCMRGKLDYFLPPRLSSKVERLDYWILKTFPFLSPFSDAIIISVTKPSAS